MILECCFHREYHLAIAVNCQQYIAVKFLKDELCLFKTKMVDFDAFMGSLQSCKYRKIRVIRKITVLVIILSE